MQERFPKAFPPRGTLPVPLEVGVHEELMAVGAPQFGDDFSTFLSTWFHRHDYQFTLLNGNCRYTLQGAMGSDITDGQRLYARRRWLQCQKHRILKSVREIRDVKRLLTELTDELSYEVPDHLMSDLSRQLQEAAVKKIDSMDDRERQKAKNRARRLRRRRAKERKLQAEVDASSI